jgi:two-component system, OmpR family, sensor kinase
MSIRIRITLFGFAVVTAVTVVFCLAMYWWLVRSTHGDQDRMLAKLAVGTVDLLARAPADRFEDSSRGPTRLAVLDLRASSEAVVVVLDRDGAVLDSTGVADGRAPVVPATLLAAASTEGGATATVTATPGHVMRVHVRPWQRLDLGRTGYVVAAQSTAELRSSGEDLLVAMGFYLVPAFAVAAVAIWLVVGRALRPLWQLVALTDEIGSDGDLTRRLPSLRARDAPGRLSTSFNTMLGRLQDAYQRQAEALAAQRRFTADASHELRTPLTTIRLNSHFLLRHPDADPPDRMAALRDLADEADRMSRLVDGLLVLARSDAGLPMPAAAVDLVALAGRVCRQARTRHPDRRIRCVAGLTSPVWGSDDALTQLLWIMIDNAVKYTGSGGQIWVVVTRHGALAELRVSDDGCGIRPGEHNRIFERFHRSDPARQGPGAGLGLSIAARIVAVHEGRIVATDKATGGASLVAAIPLTTREANGAGQLPG